MMNTVRPVTNRRLYHPANVLRDGVFVVSGFPVSLAAFVLLVPLTALSVGTLIIWIGALLLPLTLLLASAVTSVTRARLRRWGRSLPPPRYAPARPGFAGLLRRIGEGRRWLDLAFETVVAFPLHLVTFVIAVTWSLGSLAGITHVFWGLFLPREDTSFPGLIVDAITHGHAPEPLTHSYALDAGFNLVVGLVLLATLPPVLRGLATLDAAAATAALGGGRGRTTPLTDAGWAWIVAIIVAIVTLAVSWPLLAASYGAPVVFAMFVSAAHAGALLLTVRRPGWAITLQTLAVIASAAVTLSAAGPPWPWPVMALILQAFLVLLVALRHPWPLGAVAWGVPQAAALMASIAWRSDPGARTNMIVSASVTAGILVVGIIIAQLISSRSALRAERRTSADLSAHSRELDARNRIAQELHDVVAHSMSVISVQATTARYRLSHVDADTEREFQSIADSSRRALSEMRGLLSLLRSPDESEGAPLTPQPTLADVPALVEATRLSGTSVVLTLPSTSVDQTGWGSADPLAGIGATTALTGYRVVQEALSNAVRHAPGADITVALDVVDESLTIEVLNGPPVAADHPAAPGAGLGLTGVRERVHALGGSVEAGPVTTGGFRLRATLPLM